MKSRVETNTKLVISVLITSCLVIPPNRDLMYVTWPVDNKTVHHYTQQNSKSLRLDGYGALSTQPRRVSAMFLVRKPYLAFDWAPTLGARGFSCAVSVFGQVLKSDPREPLVYSTFGRTRFRLQPTKRRSPSHARKNLWYPGYWAPGNSKTVCNVCGERSWSRILASFFKKIPLHQDIFRFSESRTLSQIPKMPPWVSVKRFFRYYRQAVLDIIYFKNRIFTYS